MNRNAAKLLLAVVLLTALAAAFYAGKPATVKGYVLDSACAFNKGLNKPIAKNAQLPVPRRALPW